jgi:DNA anti-recombination protein RmuC
MGINGQIKGLKALDKVHDRLLEKADNTDNEKRAARLQKRAERLQKVIEKKAQRIEDKIERKQNRIDKREEVLTNLPNGINERQEARLDKRRERLGNFLDMLEDLDLPIDEDDNREPQSSTL